MVVANSLQRMIYKEVRIEGLTTISSDHKPLLLSIGPSGWLKKRPFRFEVSQTKEDECNKIIGKEWYGRNYAYHHLKRVQTTLNQCISALFRCNKTRMPMNEKVIKEKYEVIRKLQKGGGSHNVKQ